MNKIEEINTLSEQILNQQALMDAKQLGLQACTIAAQLATENEGLTAELEKYRAAQQGGQLVVLPCKVGDTIWWIESDELYSAEITHGNLAVNGDGTFTICCMDWHIEDFGKTVFLTREAAENALKEGEDGDPQ